MSAAVITFRVAANHVLTWGKYKGKTIDQIAASDRGLLWIDWARGLVEAQKGNTWACEAETLRHLVVYLSDPSIAGQLEALVQRGAQT